MPDINFDETVIPKPEKESKTKLLTNIDITEEAEPTPFLTETNRPPWRVLLDIISAKTQIIIDCPDSIILGRSFPNPNPIDGLDLSAYDAYQKGLSRHHALLTRTQGNMLVQDLRSVNGTLLNDKRLKPSHNYVVSSGDILQLGELRMRIRFLHNPVTL